MPIPNYLVCETCGAYDEVWVCGWCEKPVCRDCLHTNADGSCHHEKVTVAKNEGW